MKISTRKPWIAKDIIVLNANWKEETLWRIWRVSIRTRNDLVWDRIMIKVNTWPRLRRYPFERLIRIRGEKVPKRCCRVAITTTEIRFSQEPGLTSTMTQPWKRSCWWRASTRSAWPSQSTRAVTPATRYISVTNHAQSTHFTIPRSSKKALWKPQKALAKDIM